MSSIESKSAAEDREYVAGLEKGLSIIEAFGIEHRALTLAEAAKITGHTRASARRSLLTLLRLGYVETDGKRFRLAARVLRLGHAYVASNPLPKVVQPILEALSQRVQEPSSLAVLDSTEVVFVARASNRRSLSSGLSMGSRLPAFCTATGRALPREERDMLLKRSRREPLTPHTRTALPELMALLDQAHGLGYAYSDEELEPGVRSIAVPVADASGRVVAAMSIAAASARYTVEKAVDLLLPELESSRRMLSTLL
jgi:IclR family pca regulon transcriptional regulator